jgi:SAM-dependent methyltransferase
LTGPAEGNAGSRRSGVVHDRGGVAARLNAWRKRSLLSPYSVDWRYLSRSVAARAPHASGLLVDVGTSEGPYRRVFAPYVTRYVGLESPSSVLEKRPDLWAILARLKRAVDVFGDGNRLPFADASVDTVLSTEVLEHVPDPRRCMREMARILKPGGRLLVTVPFVHPLHELPLDFYRFTPSALAEFACAAGLEVERIEPRGNLAAACGALCTQLVLRTAGARARQSDGSVVPSRWRNALLSPVYALIQAGALVLASLCQDGAVALGYSLVARKP